MKEEKDLGADAAAVESAEQGSEKSAIARHTPGPWEVVRHNHINNELWLSVNQCADAQGMKHWIAEIKYRTADDAQQWADAHLIAAAPEMYEALKHAIGILEGMDVDALGEGGTSDDSWHLRDEYLHHFHAAIAKAEGRS